VGKEEGKRGGRKRKEKGEERSPFLIVSSIYLGKYGGKRKNKKGGGGKGRKRRRKEELLHTLYNLAD